LVKSEGTDSNGRVQENLTTSQNITPSRGEHKGPIMGKKQNL